jgi:hypothetical protein
MSLHKEDRMVSVLSLWLPILVASVLVFIVSSIIHMATPWHSNDWKSVPDEDRAMNTLRQLNLAPGDYCMPKAGSMEAMGKPEFQEKMKKGPVVFMTVRQPGAVSMTGPLINWFLFSVVVSFFTAYVTGVALPSGTVYLKVFQIAGCVAFMAYSFASIPTSTWYGRNWGTTIRGVIDGLLYGLFTAGAFGWLWP